jgi:hypothetical protein
MLSLAPRYAYLVTGGADDPDGGGAAVALRFGISDSAALHAAALWTSHAIDATEQRPQGATLRVLSLIAGASYAIDAIPLAPRLEAGLGVLHQQLDDQASTDLALRIGLLLDYWLLDWLAVGASVYYHALLTDPTDLPVYVDLGPHLALRWP